MFEFGTEETAFHRPGQPFDESLDPCHAPDCVREQLSGPNGGFVKNFVAKTSPPQEWRKLPMGYFAAQHLPTYDFLAPQYCVCDHWHSSIRATLWPNRLYSLAGRAGARAAPLRVTAGAAVRRASDPAQVLDLVPRGASRARRLHRVHRSIGAVV